MTDEQIVRGELYPINRRNVLKSAAVLGAVGTFGLPMGAAGNAAASSHGIETLYLTDSGGDNGGSFLTKLYEVDLVMDGTGPRAELELLYDVTNTSFGQVDAIAASLDGTIVYMVDKVSRHLGTYDVDTDDFVDEGVISGLPGGVVLASYAPDGTLYVASQSTNKLYTVDVAGPSATEFVEVNGATITGADIAFDATGTLYLYSSSQQKLYTIDYDAGSGTFGQATEVGMTGDFFTGLAVREAGDGDLVGSNTDRDEIVVVNKTTGDQGTAYPMYLGTDRYAYGFGDMTVGALDVETCDPCELDGTYKFEYVYDEETEMDGFYLEDGEEMAFSDIVYADYESKDDEMYEPISVTFESDICPEALAVTVKAGRMVGTPTVEGGDGTITVSIDGLEAFTNPKNGKVYAISYVEFECVEYAE